MSPINEYLSPVKHFIYFYQSTKHNIFILTNLLKSKARIPV